MKKFLVENWLKLLLLTVAILIFTIFYKKIEFYFAGHQGMATIWGYVFNTIVIVFAMWFIDNQNKKRWQKDSLQKCKNDTAVASIRGLADCISLIDIKGLDLKIISEDAEFKQYFGDCYDNLSQFGIFNNNNSEVYKKTKKLRILIQNIPIFLNNVLPEKDILQHFQEKATEEGFQELFPKKYNNFSQLVEDFYVTAKDLHKELVKECELEKT